MQVPREFLVQALNRLGSGREYAELEARVCLYLDVDRGRVRSLTAYANQWQWHKSTVHRRWNGITRDVWDWCSWYGRAPDNTVAKKYLEHVPGSSSTAYEPSRNANGTLVQHDGTKNGVFSAETGGGGTEAERSRNAGATHSKQPNNHNNLKEKDVLRTSKKKGWDEDLIEEIYQCYPRKRSKRAALKAIPKALDRIRKSDDPPGDPAEWLKARVTKFANSPAGNKGSFTPYPASWFNADGFDDADEEWYREDGKSTQAKGDGRSTLRQRAEGVGKYDGYLEG